MVNHSVPANAYYEVSEDEVALLLNQNESVQAMDEITISYGHKPAAEFLFSYGFIDRHSIKQAMVLTYEPPDEDPLARAKAAAYGRPGTVTLARTDDGTIQWESPFIHFAVLNEEDGLELRVLEGPNGTRNLHTFWQGEDVTNATDTFEALTEGHERKSVFRLRAVVTVLAVIKNQLVSMRLPIPDAPAERAAQGVSYSAWQAAATLTEIETAILQDAEDALETQVSYATGVSQSPIRVKWSNAHWNGKCSSPWPLETCTSVSGRGNFP